MPFEIFKGKSGKFYFRLKARNGEIILQSEGYAAKAGAKGGVQSVINNASDDARFEERETKNGDPYFVLKAKNGEVIGRSEFYKTRQGMRNGMKSVRNNAKEGVVKDITAES